MKNQLLLSFLAVSLAGGSATAHNENLRLRLAMKIIAQDVNTLAQPTTVTNPATVKDDAIQLGVLKARTAAFLLQQLNDKKGVFDESGLQEQEFTPAGLDDLDETKAKERLDEFAKYLIKSKADVGSCEKLLEIELKKMQPDRNFTALKNALPDLDAFKP